MAQSYHHSRLPKIKNLQYCTEPPLPPDATGMKSEFSAQSVNTIQMAGNSILKGRCTLTRPVDCRTWVTIRCASEERVGFERRDPRQTERRDVAGLSSRCSVDNSGDQ